MVSDSPDLMGLPGAELRRVLGAEFDVPYRTDQIARWVYEHGVTEFGEMANLKRELRVRLAARFRFRLPAEAARRVSLDGTVKYLLRLADGAAIEAVYMPAFGDAGESERATLCLSSQAGCPLACQFCVTGWAGAGRNLTAGEIAGQYLMIAREHRLFRQRLNLVFMGMGEPMLNLQALSAALDLIYKTVSPRRVTVSTAGVVPGILEMGRWNVRPNLAISLNAPDDERRSEIMPVNRAYSIAALLDAAAHYRLERGRRVTYEYVLLEGFNDSPRDAEMLAELLVGRPCKVNVIPLNEDVHLLRSFRRPSETAVSKFVERLAARRLTVTVRRSRGLDIGAACGQLMSREREALR